MKNLLLLLAVVAGTGLSAHAQQPDDARRIRLGVKAGLNLAKFNGAAPTSTWQVGALAGILANVPFSPRLALQPEVLYSRKGNLNKALYYQPYYGWPGRLVNYTEALHYLDVPVLLRARLGRLLVLEAGPQASWLLSASSTLDTGSTLLEDDTRSQYEGFDPGYVVGAGVQLRRQLQVGVRYTGSFSGSRTLGPAQRNQVVQFQAAYLLRLDDGHYR